MPGSPSFTPQLIGQTEKTLNVILERLLDSSDLSEHQWITLTLSAALTAEPGATIDRAQLAVRVAGALKVGERAAQARITELAAAELLDAGDGDRSSVKLTDRGKRLHGRLRAGVEEITARLWGDLPAEDLDTAARVLSTVLDRADAELAHH